MSTRLDVGNQENFENHLKEIGVDVKKSDLAWAMLYGLEVRVNPNVPQDEVWIVKNGKIIKKIKFSNGQKDIENSVRSGDLRFGN